MCNIILCNAAAPPGAENINFFILLQFRELIMIQNLLEEIFREFFLKKIELS